MKVKSGMRFRAEDGRLFLGIMLYLLTIFAVYYFILSKIYAYAKMLYTPNLFKLLLAACAVAVSLVFLPRKSNRPSTYLFYIYYTITFLPTIMYYWMADRPTPFALCEAACFVLIELMLKGSLPALRLRPQRGRLLLRLLLVFYFAGSVLLILHNGGVHTGRIFSDLYSVRSSNNLSGLWGYLLNWCAKSFMPFFFAYFYLKKNYLGVLAVSFLQALLFLSYGFKAFLVAVLMLAAVSVLMRRRDKFKTRLTVSFSLANLLAMMVFYVGSLLVLDLFPYRTLMLPAQGQFEYYDFFTNNDYLRFSEGSLGRLLGNSYPYDQQIGRIVNIYIYGPNKNSNGNTGALSYGFADLGFAGMLLAAFVIGLVFLAVDSFTRDMPVSIPASAMAYQMFTLNDNNILICLNTGGIVWTLLLLLVLNSVYTELRRQDDDREHRPFALRLQKIVFRGFP